MRTKRNAPPRWALYRVKMTRFFCGYGGTGRRAWFRFMSFTRCRFDSCYPHHKNDKLWLVVFLLILLQYVKFYVIICLSVFPILKRLKIENSAYWAVMPSHDLLVNGAKAYDLGLFSESGVVCYGRKLHNYFYVNFIFYNFNHKKITPSAIRALFF